MREKIANKIDALIRYSQLDSKELNEAVAFVQDRLYEALNSSNSFDTEDQFRSYVYEDNDPLHRDITENVSNIESFVEMVRDIQNDILDEFVEFKVARNIDLIKKDD